MSQTKKGGSGGWMSWLKNILTPTDKEPTAKTAGLVAETLKIIEMHPMKLTSEKHRQRVVTCAANYARRQLEHHEYTERVGRDDAQARRLAEQMEKARVAFHNEIALQRKKEAKGKGPSTADIITGPCGQRETIAGDILIPQLNPDQVSMRALRIWRVAEDNKMVKSKGTPIIRGSAATCSNKNDATIVSTKMQPKSAEALTNKNKTPLINRKLISAGRTGTTSLRPRRQTHRESSKMRRTSSLSAGTAGTRHNRSQVNQRPRDCESEPTPVDGALFSVSGLTNDQLRTLVGWIRNARPPHMLPVTTACTYDPWVTESRLTERGIELYDDIVINNTLHTIDKTAFEAEPRRQRNDGTVVGFLAEAEIRLFTPSYKPRFFYVDVQQDIDLENGNLPSSFI